MSSNNDDTESSLKNGLAITEEEILAGHSDSDDHYQQGTLDPESNEQNLKKKIDDYSTRINPTSDYQPTNKIW